MRKLILISAFVLASVSVQAVEARELILAASDAPAVAAPATPPPLTPAAAPAAAPVAATAAPAAPAATADKPRQRRRRSLLRRQGSRPPVRRSPSPRSSPVADPRPERRAEGAPDRRQVWSLLVMRKCIIVAVMFRLALACQNNHRDVGGCQNRGRQMKTVKNILLILCVCSLVPRRSFTPTAFQSAAAADRRSLSGRRNSSKFLRRTCRHRA